MKTYLTFLSFLLLGATQAMAGTPTPDSTKFAVINYSDTDLNLGIIHLTWDDGKTENLAQALQIEKPLSAFRSNRNLMEIRLLHYMNSKGYDLLETRDDSYAAFSSRWIFRKR